MQSIYETLSADIESSNNLAFLEGTSHVSGEENLCIDPRSANNSIPVPVITNVSLLEQTDSQESLTNLGFYESDIFQCGKCKLQFNNLQVFLYHKSSECFNSQSSQYFTLYNTWVDKNANIEQSPSSMNVSSSAQCDPSNKAPHSTCQFVSGTAWKENNIDCTGMPTPNSLPRGFISEKALSQSNCNIAENQQHTDHPACGASALDHLSIGNGLISSLFQQIPSHEPMHSISDDPNLTFQSVCTSPCAEATTTITLSSVDSTIDVHQPDKITETILSNLQSKSTFTSLLDDPTPPYSHFENVETNVKKADAPDSPFQLKKKFSCQYCNKMFSKNFDLQQHERSHTGEKPFQCIVCGRAFAQKSNVKKHMASHKVWLKANHTFNQSFAIDKSLQTDGVANSSSNLAPFVCEYCGKGFSTYYERKTHMKDHKDLQVYKCLKEGCSITFCDLDQFIAHVKGHNSGMTYRCHQCHKVFKSLHDLGVHQYQVHLNSKKKCSQNKLYACNLCPSKFTHPTALHEHMSCDSHSYVCRFCNAKFTCERYLRKHYFLQHKNSNKKTCTVCGKQLRSAYYLRLHMLIHTKELPYHCSKCNAAFNRKDKVKRHMLTAHDPVKRFKCPFKSVLSCTKEFNRADKLKEHIISHSSVKKIFQCAYCNKKYRKNSCKVRHEKTHSSEVQCPKCKQNFGNQNLMVSHQCEKHSAADGGQVQKDTEVSSNDSKQMESTNTDDTIEVSIEK